ncbi:DUF5677 domain-containing protein [Streptomyces sp. NBC_00094]|uniref:DUF5677 domain-containing protein n=1 Tax=Streptomyces sp. NBC_00094 TaxID=2903620 RepID=UPI00225B0DC3|nr:DUF5677 domain-containing protein [Streptomyces sp. NBC_00094]MCX5391302.1 DUF5677 domain-containing protein [Streptomyces sp. NBC_00094]
MSRFDDLQDEQVKIITGDDGEVRRTLEEWQVIIDQAQDTLVRDIERIAPDVTRAARKALKRGKIRRFHEKRHAERAHLKKLGVGFRDLEEAVILAETGNRDASESFARWLVLNKGSDELLANSINAPNTLGGPAVRALTFLGLHARGCTLVSEVLLLVRHGFIKGAHSRARSLYELTTTLAFLSLSDEPPYVLTERYSLSGLVEARRDLQGSAEGDPFDGTPGLEEAIRSAWGDRYFKPYGWAIPAIGDGTAKQVTFRDIDESVGNRDWRHAYLTMNHSVHAGAAAAASLFDRRGTFRHRTGSTVDYYDAAWVLSITALLFEGLQIPIFLDLSPLLGADMELDFAPVSNRCAAAKTFFDGYIDKLSLIGES